MDLKNLTTFIHVAELGSFTKAGAALGCSQSTISFQIRQLEEELEFPLFERINRTGTTVLVATHDREMVDSMRRRVIALENGRIIRDQERGVYGNYGAI